MGGKSLLLTVGLVFLVFVVACGSGDETSSKNGLGNDFDPRPIMRRAVEQLFSLESAAFTLEHVAGTTEVLPGLGMSKVFGVVEIPSKFAMTVEAELAAPRSYIEIGVVTIDDTAYMTDMFSGQWRAVSPSSLPFTLNNLGDTLAGVIDAVREPALIGEDRLRGIATYRIRGAIKSQDLALLVPGAGTGFDVGLELWLDQSNGLLRQALITGKVVSTDIDEAVRRLALDDINVPANITAPH